MRAIEGSGKKKKNINSLLHTTQPRVAIKSVLGCAGFKATHHVNIKMHYSYLICNALRAATCNLFSMPPRPAGTPASERMHAPVSDTF